jgi:hypothetical protein
MPRRRDPEPPSCPGPIICFAVPGESRQIGECRCGLIVVGVVYEDMPADHRHAALVHEGLAG